MSINKKKFLKAFLRSRDYQFSLDFSGGGGDAKGIGRLEWRNKNFYYRYNTSDAFVAYECMLHGKRNAYQSNSLPGSNDVRIIVDVGSNVGASVLFWKDQYPNSEIYCFEPIPDNFAILQRNCAGLAGVTPFNQALGDKEGELAFIHSPGDQNEGGWSVFQRNAKGDEKKISIPVLKSGDRIRELGLNNIDILKVDTEGAESMIIRGIDDDLLSRVRYICGELHGENDFALLDYIESKGFSVGLRKNINSVLFNFEAQNILYKK